MLTRIHMRVDMKTLLNLAGMRLCTQAQFEWRAVFAELAKAIRSLGGWQYELIADSFRPVCFAENHCTMKAKSDRYCSIRAQVDLFEAEGVKSELWEDPDFNYRNGTSPIHPAQWLADPTAARVAPGGN
jgi:thymidylate synthase ThyX